MNGIKAKSPLQDSGERTHFETGAMREIVQGKGRFDLLPLAEISNIVTQLNVDNYNEIFSTLLIEERPPKEGELEVRIIAQIYSQIYLFRKFGSYQMLLSTFHLGVILNAYKSGVKLDSIQALNSEYITFFFNTLWELAKHYENGALKYEARNWEKGLPLHSFIDSALRHLTKVMVGLEDEPHNIAFLWNIVCAMYTKVNHPSLDDFTIAGIKKNGE
jgi:hypothetical protein